MIAFNQDFFQLNICGKASKIRESTTFLLGRESIVILILQKSKQSIKSKTEVLSESGSVVTVYPLGHVSFVVFVCLLLFFFVVPLCYHSFTVFLHALRPCFSAFLGAT